MTITAAKLLVWVGGDTKEAESALNAVTKKFEGMGQSMQKAGKALTLGITAPAAIAATAMVKLAMSAEQNKIAFTTMLKSGEKAEEFLTSLRDFAAKTPFEFTELVDASRRMIAFGFAAKDVLPMLTDIGDAVSGLGLGSEGVNRITLALGQMQAKSKVSAQEMMQLTEAGIPAWKYLAQAMGLSTAEVMKLSERGLLPADKAIQAILAGMRQDFGGMMAEQSQTAAGQLSNLKDELVKLGTELGTILLPTVKDLIGAGREAVQAFSGLSDESKRGLVNIALGIAAIGPALMILGKLTVMMTALPAIVNGVTAAFAAWRAGMTLTTALGAAGLAPMAITLGAIAVAVGALIGVWAAWNKNIVKTNKEGQEAVKSAWGEFFEQQVKSGKSAAQVLDEYRKKQAFVNQTLKDAGIIRVFIKDQEQLKSDTEGLNNTLALTATSYEGYITATTQAQEITNIMTQEQWEAVRAQEALNVSSQAGTEALAQQEAGMFAASLGIDRLKQASWEATSADEALRASIAAITADAQTAKDSLGGLMGQYDSLQAKMDDWVQNTASQVVDMLGTRFSEASETYRAALAEVDAEMGTSYTQQLETKDAVKALVDQYARDKDLSTFREGLKKIKEEGLADMKKELEDVTLKAQALYDKLLALPKSIQIAIDFQVGDIPAWVQTGGKAATNPGKGNNAGFVLPEEYAKGGDIVSGRPYVVGEEGIEVIVPKTSGRVIPNDKLGSISPTINITANVSNQADIYNLAKQIADEIRRRNL